MNSSLQGVIIKWQRDFSTTNTDLINYMSNYGAQAIMRMEMAIFLLLLCSYFNLSYGHNSLHLIIGDCIINIVQAISFLLSTIIILYNTSYSPGIGVFIKLVIIFKVFLLLILLAFGIKLFINYIYHIFFDSTLSIPLYIRAVNSILVAIISLFTSIFLQLSMKINVTKDEVIAYLRSGIKPYERLLRKENNYINLDVYSPTKEMKVKRTAMTASSGFTVGAKVLSRYKEDRLWFPGKISALHKNNTFDIVYDDGDIEFYKTRENVELLSSLVLMEQVQENGHDIAHGLVSMWKWTLFLHLVITCLLTFYSTLAIALDGSITEIISTLLLLSIDMMIIGTIFYIIAILIKVMSALYR